VSGEIGTRKIRRAIKLFPGNGNRFGCLNFPKNGTYAISAWAYTDTVDRRYHTIACKAITSTISKSFHRIEWEFAEYADAAGWEMTTSHATEKVWTYVTGIRNGSNEYLYVNGALAPAPFHLAPARLPVMPDSIFSSAEHKNIGHTTAYFL